MYRERERRRILYNICNYISAQDPVYVRVMALYGGGILLDKAVQQKRKTNSNKNNIEYKE